MTKQISKADLKSVLPDKLALYHSLQRNRYYVPKMSSRLCSVTYLLGIRKGQLWVPRYEQVRLAPCPLPPTKKEFVDEVFRHLASKNVSVNLGFGPDEWDKVDLDWIKNVLSTLDPEHRFFHKGYVPEEKVKEGEKGYVTEGEFQFLQGLPQVRGKFAKYKAKSRAAPYIQMRQRGYEMGRVKQQDQRYRAQLTQVPSYVPEAEPVQEQQEQAEPVLIHKMQPAEVAANLKFQESHEDKVVELD